MLGTYIFKCVRGVGGRANVQFLEDHLVLRQRPRLVREKVGHAAELLRYGSGPGHRARRGLVLL